MDAGLPPGAPRLSRLAAAELDAELLARVERYPLAAGDEAIVARALSYPYEPPPRSYVLVRRDAVALGDAGDLDGLAAGRRTVLAYGSNGAPEALLRKLARTPEEEARLVLPVVAGTLRDFDVVYSSHLSAYGSLPVTLHPAPGAAVRAFALLADDEQLVRLIETEFNYSVQRLRGLRFAPGAAGAPRVDEAIAFVSRHGALGIAGAPVRLATTPQREALELVRDRLAPHESLEEFVLSNVRDPRRAARFTAELRREGLPFRHPGAEVLDR